LLSTTDYGCGSEVSRAIDYRLRLLYAPEGKLIDYILRLPPIDYRSMHLRAI